MEIKKIKLKKSFLKNLFLISIPIIIQNFITSSLNMVDTIMIGNLGETQIASVGLANQIFFFVMLLGFGINSGGSIFMSQFYGKKNYKGIKSTMGICFSLGAIIGFIFFIVAVFFPSQLMKIFIKDESVIMLGSSYLRIVGFSYPITMLSFTMESACRSIGKTKLPMVVSIISLGANTILNYLLIFGNFNFPQLGVDGAAYATLISRIIQLIIMYFGIRFMNFHIKFTFDELRFDNNLLKRYIKISLPVIFNEGMWALGTIGYMVIYGYIGKEAVASIQIAMTIQNLFSVIMFGLGHGSAIIIGNKIGENELEEAYEEAISISILTPIMGILIGSLIYLFNPLILYFFNISNEVLNDIKSLLIIIIMFLPIKFFNINMIIGVCRSGGDTKFGLIIDLLGVWIVAIPLGILGGIVLKLGVIKTFFLISLEEAPKVILAYKRLISKKWLKNITNDL
ncbi:MAG: MATE family efflux transporter [Peptostreptococcaceae bacterium]|nr:MATE family efflux transporter [Peptostreptococcaceae bacterium]